MEIRLFPFLICVIQSHIFVISHLNRSSASEECIAPYGGNVESALAVGGFLQYGDEAYEKADAIVVTYLLNNHLDGKDLKAAIQWENQ